MQPGTLMQENKVIQSTISSYMWELIFLDLYFSYLVNSETWAEKTGCSRRLGFTMHIFNYYSFKN